MALPSSTGSPPWRLLTRQFTPATDYGEHAHDVATLTLTLSGEYREEFEDTRQTCGPLGLQLKPQGVPHTTIAERGAELFVVHLQPGLLAQSGLAELDRPRQWEPGIASAIALACRRAASEGAVQHSNVGALLRSLLLRLTPMDGHSAGTAPGWMRTVLRRLRNELATPPRLAELAHEADVHLVYLARVFRRLFGRSVGEWIRGARIERAVGALANTPEDVASIALELGYYDQSHFGRDFRRETGWSPARFRTAVRSLAAPAGRLAEFRSS